MRQRECERQGDTLAQGDTKAEYSLESIVRGLHVCKYIRTPCLSERLSLRTDMGMRKTRIILCCFGDKDARLWATYRESSAVIAVHSSFIKCIRLIKGVSYAIKLCA